MFRLHDLHQGVQKKKGIQGPLFNSFSIFKPAYLQDTTDVLNKMKELNNIGTVSFLVTMDMESLYTTIKHEQGLAAMHHFLSTRPETEMPPTEFIVSLTEWTLKS